MDITLILAYTLVAVGGMLVGAFVYLLVDRMARTRGEGDG